MTIRQSAARLALLMCCALLIGACNLGSDGGDDSRTPTPDPLTGPPAVAIESPGDGSEVRLNQEVIVQITASDRIGVSRVNVSVNGRSVRTFTPPAGSDARDVSFIYELTPTTTSDITISAVAFRGTGINAVQSPPDQITLVVEGQGQATQTPPVSNPGGPGGNPNPGPIIDPTGPCSALTLSNLNFRTGPGTTYSVITTFAANTVLPLVARLGDNSWFQVRSGATFGWISGSPTLVQLYGGTCSTIPIVSAPATPRPVATNTPQPTAQPTATSQPSPTPQGAPNLDAPVIFGPTTLQIPAGQSQVSAQYGVTIRNRGGSFSTSFSNTIQISGSPPVLLGTIGGLAANQSTNLDTSLTFTGAATYTITVVVDSTNAVAEDSETDNIASIQVVVTSGGPPGS
jgi:hypothetical protein